MRTFKNTFYSFTVGGVATQIPTMAMIAVNPVTNAIALTNNTTVTPVEDVMSVLRFGHPAVDGNYFSDAIPVTQPTLAPTNGALTQTAAGALPATTYYVKSTWVTASGETAPSVETSLAVLINNILHVAAPGSAPATATGWNVYVSATTGTETKQNTTPIALGTPWVEPTTGLVAGAALPSSSGAAGLASLWLTTCNIIRIVPNLGVQTGVNSFVVTNNLTYGISEIVSTFKETDGLVEVTTFGSNTVAPNAMTFPATTKFLLNPRYITKQVGHALTTATTTSVLNAIAAVNVLDRMVDILGWSE